VKGIVLQERKTPFLLSTAAEDYDGHSSLGKIFLTVTRIYKAAIKNKYIASRLLSVKNLIRRLKWTKPFELVKQFDN
jgi:hypothetical protein